VLYIYDQQPQWWSDCAALAICAIQEALVQGCIYNHCGPDDSVYRRCGKFRREIISLEREIAFQFSGQRHTDVFQKLNSHLSSTARQLGIPCHTCKRPCTEISGIVEFGIAGEDEIGTGTGGRVGRGLDGKDMLQGIPCSERSGRQP
jgi:hypothetical protein